MCKFGVNPANIKTNLKKQSQFSNIQNNIRIIFRMVYIDFITGGNKKTKPISFSPQH